MKNQYRDNGDGTTTLVIHSEKYGLQESLIDTEDVNRIKVFHWCVKNNDSNIFYLHASIGFGARRKEFISTISLHRLVMSFPITDTIDHINGNGFDNRKYNLRVATFSQNRRNSISISKKSRYRGVYERNDSPGKYRAQIRYDSKLYNLGTFTDPVLAAKRYDEEASKHFKDYSVLNFPDQSKV